MVVLHLGNLQVNSEKQEREAISPDTEVSVVGARRFKCFPLICVNLVRQLSTACKTAVIRGSQVVVNGSLTFKFKLYFC